ncbi:hypothetical protein LguiA_017104 [Lonicera macranthoides]
MAFKALLFLLASFLVLNVMVSSQNEEHFVKGPFRKVPPTAPAESLLKVPPPCTNATAKSLPPSAPVKPPAPSPAATPPTGSPRHPPRTRIECMPLCIVRCKYHSRKNVCMRSCLACCERCKCVPPGQYGNHAKCGKCYANMTTHGGKLKCP